jgi:hypothetical protein
MAGKGVTIFKENYMWCRFFFAAVLLLGSMQPVLSQESRFFIPVEIKQAYEKGTRSPTGKPGGQYWQNRADYTIDVEVVPSDQTIVGSEEVIYHNLSPDVLSSLVVRLYHDVNKKGAVRLYVADAGDLTEGVELSNLRINGKPYDLDDHQKVKRSGTNIKFLLEEPLEPGDSLVFTTSWQQEIPANDTRIGSYDSTSFFIGYWYPQIAVYDDIFGWDELSFDILREFYNGPANFNVTVNAPEGYLVWATGALMNASEVYPTGIYETYNSAWSSKDVISIVSWEDIEAGIQTKRSLWLFQAREVSDFAFFLSDHFVWDASSQVIDGQKVLVSTVHPSDKEKDYAANVNISRDAIKYFSDEVPGIAYPFESFTTVVADGWGMEFPMMAHNSSPGHHVTIHEMLHSYFPMYVFTNESRWSWMDEGWVSLWTQLAVMKLIEGEQNIDHVVGKIGRGIRSGFLSDLPLMVSSEYLNDFNYGQASYSKPAFIFAMIWQYMGDELFLNCSQAFISRWAGKSPTPYDLFYTFENISGQDLNWIWKPWFFDFGSADVKIDSFSKELLTVSMVGNQPMALVIDLAYLDGTNLTLYENMGIWSDSKKAHAVKIPNHSEVTGIIVNRDLPDADRSNNRYLK